MNLHFELSTYSNFVAWHAICHEVQYPQFDSDHTARIHLLNVYPANQLDLVLFFEYILLSILSCNDSLAHFQLVRKLESSHRKYFQIRR